MVFIDKNRKKNLIFLLFILPFICGVVFFANPHIAHAGFWDGIAWVAKGITGFVGNAVMIPFNMLLYAVFLVNGLLFIFAGVLMDWAVNPANFAIVISNNAGIYQSWKFVRDILNLFFIVFFLFAAFATIFQVEAYNYKKILLKLVIMALLVNFSFPISRFIIDIANVLFYGILSLGGFSQGATFSGTFASGWNIAGIVAPDTSAAEIFFSASTLTVKLIFSNIFLFVAAVTFLILGALFVIRIAVLGVLIVFSPVGFVAGVFPGTKKFADEWWSALLNQAFFAPVMALMVVVALNVMKAMNSNDVLKKSIEATIAPSSVNGDYSTTIVAGASMAIPLIILWIGMVSAKKFGAIGADSVVGLGEKVAKWGAAAQFKAGWAGAKWVGRKYDKTVAKSSVGKYFSPSVIKEAWKRRSEEQSHNDQRPVKEAAATMQDQMNNAFSRAENTLFPWRWRKSFAENTDHTDHRFAEREAQKNEHMKEIKDVSTRAVYVIDEAKAAIAAGDGSKVEAAINILANNNDLNDLVLALGEKYGDGTAVVSSKNAKKVLVNMFKAAGVTNEEDIAKSLIGISDTALASGNFAFGGMTHYENGHFSVTTEEQQAGQMAGKFANFEPQEQARKLHPDALFKRSLIPKIDDSGAAIIDPVTGQPEREEVFGDINDMVGEAVMTGITSVTAAQSNRSRTDMQKAIMNAYKGALDPKTAHLYPKFIDNFNKKPNFKNYVKAMLTQYNAETGNAVDLKKTLEEQSIPTSTPPSAAPPVGGTGSGAGVAGGMSSGAHGTPVYVPPVSAGGGPRKTT